MVRVNREQNFTRVSVLIIKSFIVASLPYITKGCENLNTHFQTIRIGIGNFVNKRVKPSTKGGDIHGCGNRA